jgi:hypothetical protein
MTTEAILVILAVVVIFGGAAILKLRRGAFWIQVLRRRAEAHPPGSLPEMESSPEGPLSPFFRKWALGVFLPLVLIVWGLASLAYGRFVLKRIVLEGTPALLLAVALISFGLAGHFHAFWSANSKAGYISIPGARLFAFVGGVCLILGLCFLLIGLAA